MAAELNVITGATGLLGSHIAEQLAQDGEQIRVLVRPSSDTRYLQSLRADLSYVYVSGRSTPGR